jgi:predicted membrane-bound spermidine synthase/Tfp pilus assembly protein PilF
MNAKTNSSISSVWIPCLTAFAVSAGLMALELVAGRLLARQMGSSLYTWTSIIGVILLGMTLGAWIGGRWADRAASSRLLSRLLLGTAMSCVVAGILRFQIPQWQWLLYFPWSAQVVINMAVLWLVPSCLMGMTTPILAKVALEGGLASGRTLGLFYACGAAGSIAGTFAAGFWLISWLGAEGTLWSVVALLTVMAIGYRPRQRSAYGWSAALAVAIGLAYAPYPWARIIAEELYLREPFDAKVLYQDETPYCLVRVVQKTKIPDRRSFMQDKLMHSMVDMDNVGDLLYSYTKIYDSWTKALAGSRTAPKMMVIGGGGYVFPRYLQQQWPQSPIEVVEIDKGVTRAAQEAFGLDPDSPIRTISLDARNFVEDQVRRRRQSPEAFVPYDFIYEDAINDYSVPYPLVTREFNEKIHQILSDDGYYMVNLIDIYDVGRFVGSMIQTLRQTFAFVQVMTDFEQLLSARRTFVLIAGNKPPSGGPGWIPQDLSDPGMYWNLTPAQVDSLCAAAGGMVLTDDFAPVENLMAPVVGRDALSKLAKKFVQDARQQFLQNRQAEGLELLQKAIRTSPLALATAYDDMAVLQMEQGRYQQAITILDTIIDFNHQHGDRLNIAGVYLNKGLILKQWGQSAKALECLTKAEQDLRKSYAVDPYVFQILTQLGNCLVELGKTADAEPFFRKAIALEPDDWSAYLYLAACLDMLHRPAEAAEVLRQGLYQVRTFRGGVGADQLKALLRKIETRAKSS